MNVTVALLMTFATAAAEPAETAWMHDYGAALQVARAEGRPLLVVIEDAERGVRADAIKLSSAADDALLAPYVLCRVDAGTAYGQKVAAAFKADRTPHLVITDRGARRQIFQRTGRMSSTEWRSTLTAYRSGRRPAPVQVWQPEICNT